MATRKLLGALLGSFTVLACSSEPGQQFGSDGGHANQAGANATQGGTTPGSGSGSGGSASGASATQGGANAQGGVASGGAATPGGATAQGGATTQGGGTTQGGASSGGSATAGGGAAKGGTANGGAGVGNGGSTSTGKGGTTSANGGANTAGSSSAGAGGASPSMGCGAAAAPAACSTAGSPCTLTVGSTEREYYVTLPANYSPSQAYPVVFAFHYRKGTAQGLLSGNGAFYGIRRTFANAIYVAPQGLGTSSDPTDYGWPNTGGQDIAFTKALVEKIESQFCVDKTRLFSTGMSYGGIMSDTVACQMGDVFRAIGVMSGAIFGNTSSCTGHRIAAWFTHGTADDQVQFSGGEKARDMVLAANHCGNTTKPVEPAPCVSYDDCDTGYPVVWCPVEGGGHTIPSFAAGAISSFFQQL